MSLNFKTFLHIVSSNVQVQIHKIRIHERFSHGFVC